MGQKIIALNTEKRKPIWIYLMAFAVPFAVMCVAFLLEQVYPIGDKQVLTIDGWHQYYPFLMELRGKIRGGESLLYSWRMGLGSGFTGLIAYYLASPLNLLFVLAPTEELLREVFAFMILAKIGLAGSFCAFALQKIYRRNEFGIVIFSSCYALCSWALGYYWSIIWLDSFAVFPLVAAGIALLVKEKKYKLYTLSLAAAVFANFYIGFMVCIFTALYFFVRCAVEKNNRNELLLNLRNIILFSIIAILMCAVVLLPVIVALQGTAKQGNVPANWNAINGWFDTLANTLAYLEPTYREGLPNVYCGVVCVVFFLAFFLLKSVSKKEKILYASLTFFLYISMNINILNFAWHGFHNTNQMPFRFSFLFSFLLVMAAYRVYAQVYAADAPDAAGKGGVFGKNGLRNICIAVVVYFVLAGLQHMGRVPEDGADVPDQGSLWILLVKNLLIIAASLAALYLADRRKLRKRAFTLVLAVVVGLELVPTALAAPKAVGMTDRSSYPEKYEQVQGLLEDIAAREGEDGFYRVEFTRRYSRNPSALYGYDGLATFTSTANDAVRQVYEDMGLPVYRNVGLWYYYQNSTPVNNAFLNLKYLISRDSEVANKEYLTQINNIGGAYAYQNDAYLPIGFMVEASMADFQFEDGTPFEKQNQLLKAATGIEEDVFEPLDIVHVGHENVEVERTGYGKYRYQPLDQEGADEGASGSGSQDGAKDGQENEKFKYNYEMPKDGCVYAFMNMNLNEDKDVSVGIDEESCSYEIRDACIFPAGTYEKGEVFSIRSEMDAGKSGELEVYVSVFNQEVFDKAYSRLQDEVLQVTEKTSKNVKGIATAKQDGLMYTSIPYEPGWKVYVDGKKADIKLVGGALMAVTLTQGEHEIEFKYAPTYVYAAALLSLSGVVLFIGICIMEKKKKWSPDAGFGRKKQKTRKRK